MFGFFLMQCNNLIPCIWGNCDKLTLYSLLSGCLVAVLTEEVTIGCELMMFVLSPVDLSFSFYEAASQKEYTVQDFLLAVNSTRHSFC